MKQQKKIYSQVAPEVNDLYEYYRKKVGLEEENDIQRKIEILIQRKYIETSYDAQLSLLVDYYLDGKEILYNSCLKAYKNRIRKELEK